MKRFKNILCAIDPETVDSAALQRAVTLAENNQASLTLVTVTEPVVPLIETTQGASIDAHFQRAPADKHAGALQALAAPYRERLTIRTRVLTGTPFLELIREVLRGRHDLLIKVTERLDWLERLLGSDDMHLLRKCPCPVWLIRPDEPSNYQCILAAVDVDDTYPPAELQSRRALNRQTLEMAVSLALSDFAALHLVHVWDAIGESAMRGAFLRTPEEQVVGYVEQVRRRSAANLDALLGEVTDRVGSDAVSYLKPQLHLIKGYAREEIPALAKRLGADLIVMGTVARTGVPGFFMGNTAETILNQIDCAVLAIKPHGFVTPVTLEA
jgi:nucleotide-binding universal stress UspA family protein